MEIYSQTLDIDTRENLEVVDITPQITRLIEASGIQNGFAIIASRHTTTALFVNEFEERLVQDIKTFFEKLVPAENKYLHNDIHLRDCPPEEPENAHSHIISMLLSNSESIPVVDGSLTTGQWQSIMFVELDGPRNRTLQVQLIGTKE